MHDTVEDTDITLEDVEREFGNEIARIVDGLTKISNVIDVNASQQAENFRKILLTLTDDPRVILIKLADRLHNMRTLDSMKREKQLKISSETVYVYAPLAHRMGLYNIKTELEDLAMKYLEPEVPRNCAQTGGNQAGTHHATSMNSSNLSTTSWKSMSLILKFMAGLKAFIPSGIK